MPKTKSQEEPEPQHKEREFARVHEVLQKLSPCAECGDGAAWGSTRNTIRVRPMVTTESGSRIAFFTGCPYVPA